MGMNKWRIRFRLWHMLLGFTVTAAGLWAIPSAIEWYAWRDVRTWLNESIAEFESKPTRRHVYLRINGPHRYAISNHKADWNENSRNITIYESSIRQGAYFVMPPEKWAKNADEAIQLLKKHYRDR